MAEGVVLEWHGCVRGVKIYRVLLNMHDINQ